ncbi:lysophosphatidylcholine acyltransferase 2 isoform X2 [Rhineura floridana]|uniref:lysophosphatidylcholine acyltransferase 2 isoform X2 n=1 Tax=Rhineura floridana TaxID=261503 RepID=UPI002AC86C5A|nr:lysophosphatidylcholine acyltransferase 2 isoform X2 [Rhineura floridana]
MTLCTEAAVAAVGGGLAAQVGAGAGGGMSKDPQEQPRVFTLPRQQSLASPLVINPFVQETRLDAKKRARAILFGIILVPLRALCMLLILLMAWLFAVLATSCIPEKGVKPLLGWQRRVSCAALTFLGRTLFFVMGFHVNVKGTIASPKEAPIIAAAPHSSFFDGILCILAGLPSTVSRQENLLVPIFGRILRALQPVTVSRVDPDSRRNTINEITRRATSGEQWPQILIFPEGTCTNRSCLITFKQGAFIPGVPVQPVLLRYPNKLDTVTWTWQGYNFKEALVLTLCQLFTKIEVEFMPVYVPSEEEKKDPILFANGVRNKMASALDVPITDHTYEDCRLMISAGQLTLPMEAGLVEFTKISHKLNLKWDSIREQLDQFAMVASASRGGRIGIEEFASYLKLPVSDALEQLFALFDRNGDGTIDFREYVIGLSVICNPANTEQTIQMAFQLFDVDEDGSINEDEFSLIIRSSLGLPNLDVSNLFKEIDADNSKKLSYEFKDFALKHPEYAKLFTTYLELQRCQVFTDTEYNCSTPTVKNPVSEMTSVPKNKVCPQAGDNDDHSSVSVSDKKED